MQDTQSCIGVLFEAFDNGNPEEFLVFISNFSMNIEASGILEPVAKAQ